MKKIIVFFTIGLVFLLAACTQTYKNNYPIPTFIEVEKDVSFGGACSDFLEYHPIQIEDEADIQAFMAELNSWEYEEERGLALDLCGFSFLISFDDVVIQVIGITYFYVEGDPMLYKFVKGNTDFLNLLNWQLVNE
ncbi:MAG: hypothetical protein ACNA7U_05790 [Candidatus Izemoplasmataceae bacterium]|uniref:hypothetical protein n=1 Tax=Liberiplasma polymorphum TaxID=3374570 RepID=UPI003772A384